MSENLNNEPKLNKSQKNAYYSNSPSFGNKGPSKIRRLFDKGLSTFFVVALCIAFYFVLLRMPDITGYIKGAIAILEPVLYGIVIAYLMNPIVRAVDSRLAPRLMERMPDRKKAGKLSRTAGIFLSLVVLIALISTLLNLLIPQLYTSIHQMVYTLPRQINHLIADINSSEGGDSTTSGMIKNVINQGSQIFTNWFQNDFMSKTNELMSNLTEGVVSAVNLVVNFLIGVIVSIYILYSKEAFMSQGKKIIYAIFNTDHANLILHLTTKSNEIFSGFIVGKIVDSLIIGIMCFVGMSILNLPYVLLISVIVGVTNIIPFFGPYIGAIPSALLILLSNPMQGLYFIIFILVLQQIDGNIIGPKILGNSTGLSPFWVIVAILLGGGAFGFIGMLFGVPVFAVLAYILEMLLQQKLTKKDLPTDTDSYDIYSYVDSEGKYIHPENDARPDVIKEMQPTFLKQGEEPVKKSSMKNIILDALHDDKKGDK